MGLGQTVISQDDTGNVSEDLPAALLVFIAVATVSVVSVVRMVVLVSFLGSERRVGLDHCRECREGRSLEELRVSLDSYVA